jgi:ribosomal protein S18 acetylase RimI-like enzyme
VTGKTEVTQFEPVELNLRACFRALASHRDGSETRAFAGIEIISLGVRFQMFNAAFLTSPVQDEADFARRVAAAEVHFGARGIKWSFWLCDGWLPAELARRAERVFHRCGLTVASEMPGMIAERPAPPTRPPPIAEMRLVEREGPALRHFREIGAVCFKVPPDWFEEVFDAQTTARTPFQAWVGYAGARPVVTAATVAGGGAIGVYNIATLPDFRGRGYAEWIARECIAREIPSAGDLPVVLQSTAVGLRLYERMGFRSVARFRVWVS